MNFILKVHLNIGGNRGEHRGQFTAKNADDIVQVAYDYIRSIKLETGYRKTIIEKVILNGEHEITDLVQEIENRPIPKMNDVFW
jgi:hypothetical protein